MRTMSLLALVILASAALAQERDFVLKPVQTISLTEDCKGRFDHMSVDEEGRRLFLAALDKGSVEAINLADGKTLPGITGLLDPSGVLWLPDLKRLVVTTRKDGRVRFYDAQLKLLGELPFIDADNLRYDPAKKTLYLGYGSAIALIDAESMKPTADIKFAAHPEAFLWEKNGTRMYVNVAKSRHIAIVDRVKNQVIATWPVDDGEYNYPMALDEPRQRLFVGCRKPHTVVIFNTDTGTAVTHHECCGDADDMWFDEARRRVYLSGGGGCVNTFEYSDGDYLLIETLSTGFNARASLWVPGQNRLYVAIPYRPKFQPPIIRVFEPQP